MKIEIIVSSVVGLVFFTSIDKYIYIWKTMSSTFYWPNVSLAFLVTFLVYCLRI